MTLSAASRGASAPERAIVVSGLPRTRDLRIFLTVRFATIRAEDVDGLRQALEEAKAADRVTVAIDPDPRVGNHDGWWDVPIAEVSAESSANGAIADYEEAIKNQRVVW